MNLTLRQLRAFITVADSGSFTEAAARLHLTQSALSVLVRELEKEMDIRLLERSTRRVSLSEAGKDFYPHALRVLQDLDVAVSGMDALKSRKRGFVRIAAPQLMACTLMPKVLAAYAAQYPEIRVTLVDTLPEQVVAKVLSGEVELGVGPQGVPQNDIVSTHLLSDRHFLICRPDHPLARRKRVTWKQMAGYPFIAQTRDYNARLMLDLAMWSNRLALTPAYEVSYMTTNMAMVAAGLGIAACPSYAGTLAHAYGLEMRPIFDPEFVREVCLFTRRGVSLSPAAEGLAQFLHEFVAAL